MTHHHYTFDRIWDGPATNDDLYSTVQPLVHRAKRGLDSTLLCYGQTGTGEWFGLNVWRWLRPKCHWIRRIMQVVVYARTTLP